MTATDANDRTDLQGQTALVTGAGRGIGRSIALALASAGANVALAARSEDELVSVAAEIEAIGPRALAISTDVSDLDALEHLFDTIDREFGRLDIQVNNAGVGLRTPLLEVTPRSGTESTTSTCGACSSPASTACDEWWVRGMAASSTRRR